MCNSYCFSAVSVVVQTLHSVNVYTYIDCPLMNVPNLNFVCCVAFHFVSLPSFVVVSPFCILCCHFTCWIYIWLIVVLACNGIYSLVLFVFCVQMLCSIDYLVFVCRFNLEQSSFFFLVYQFSRIAYLCQFSVMRLVQLVSFYFPTSISCISYLHLFIPQLYLYTGTANAPVAGILFFTFNPDFSTIRHLFVYYF
jgi:hypothetical protein